MVASAVAKILDGGPTPEERDLPRALQELQRIRAAARRILEAHLSPEHEDRLLGALARRAAHAELREWALDAMILEVRGPEIPVISHGVTVAHERLRRAAFHQCPICLGPVLSEPALEVRKRREKWAAEDRAAWDGAVR